MRAYVVTTCVIWFAIVAVHGWRAYVERNLIGDSAYIVVTALAAALGVWAALLLRRRPAT